MDAVVRLLEGNDEVSRVRHAAAARAGHTVVIAIVEPPAADELLGDLQRIGGPADGGTLIREEVLGRSNARGTEAGLVWEDVLGMASRNSRPIARYLAFMLVAGVIASYGVLEYGVILIVGAMAISPDLLPITAIGVGLV